MAERDIHNSTHNTTISARDIIITDYLSAVLALLMIVIWGCAMTIVGMALAGVDFQDFSQFPAFIATVVAASVVAIAIIKSRIRHVREFFARGHVVNGEIVSASFFRGQGFLDITYQWHGETIKRRLWVFAIRKKILDLRRANNKTIQVVVNPNNQRSVSVKEFYFN